MDWESFKLEVEERMNQDDPSDLSITERIIRFNEILIETGKKIVGKTKPGKKEKTWMTPTIRAAIRKRNAFRRNLKEKRKEWLEACKETREAILKAKEESWKEFLADTMDSSNEAQMWNVVRSLNGTPQSNSPNETMVSKGRRITSSKGKANAFIDHYAEVSKLKFDREDRTKNRLFKKRLSNASRDQKCEEP